MAINWQPTLPGCVPQRSSRLLRWWLSQPVEMVAMTTGGGGLDMQPSCPIFVVLQLLRLCLLYLLYGH
jgi:hypothetical protein